VDQDGRDALEDYPVGDAPAVATQRVGRIDRWALQMDELLN
jgi:hypothetical protein